MNILKKLLILFLLTQSGLVFSQTIYKFSNRVDKFPSELEEFMSNNIDKTRKKELKDFIDNFTQFWSSDTLTENRKKEVISKANQMSVKRMRPFPHFQTYIEAIMDMGRTPIAAEMFDVWMSSLDPLLKQKSYTDFMTYLSKSTDLFSQRRIYNSATVVWEISDFSFDIDNSGKVPIYNFKTINLKCTTRKDSNIIFQTQGKLDIINGSWEGVGGRIDWRRANLDTAKVYANLKNYSVRLNSAKFFADSVTFYDQRRFGFPIQGYLSEKILTAPPPEPIYPSFISYPKNLEIKEIFKDVDYRGGYSLKGAKIIGSGDKDQKAYFIFKRRGQRLIWAGAESFQILPDRINSDRVNVIIYLDQDSIYHPGLAMSYLDNKRLLQIYRMDEGLSTAPFYDSYHQLDLYTEAMFWKLDDDYIDLKMIQEEGSVSKAYFESLNYFSGARYDRMQGIDRINPVYSVQKFIEQQGYNEFLVEDFARYIQMSPDDTKAMLMTLATQGFLIYDINEDYCIAKDRVGTYVKANRGLVDYDVIQFNSTVRSIPNASINLFNHDLVIQGVNRVFLSDSQKVFIYPKNQRVVVKKNRDFTFDGKIIAGRFNLYAKECYFDYDKFMLKLPIIDSLTFKVMALTENEYGERPQMDVKTAIEDLKGSILVDNPENKSGRKAYPEYPILNSETNSYVYYDKQSIFNGVYDRKKNFLYRLESFVIDSLDNFQTEGLEFEGRLLSAGIFPEINQPLKVQPDYSLGFVTETGPAGLNIYGSKGKYVDQISLSNKGLRGNGELRYLTSISKSDDFIFFPDSTIATLNSYLINERKTGIEYPSVMAENVKMHWQPYKDLMRVSDYKEGFPIMMYNNEADLNGNLYLTPNNLTGNGNITINDALMTSNLYKFKNYYYNADTCDFRLRRSQTDASGLGGLGSNELDAYSTSNFKARIDFKERKGEFEANGGQQKVDFPENMYYCFMDQFVWYMDKDETEFASTAKRPENFDKLTNKDKIDIDIEGSLFTSTHPAQDSLNFVATKAVFRASKYEIHAYGVEFVRVADAAVIPDKKELLIYRKADIEELTNAKVIANATTKYFELYNGTIKIEGRRSYHGRALYDFKDETGQVNNIYFTKVYVDTTGTSIGEGEIAETAGFTLSPAFDYYGATRMIANNPYLYFTGGTRIHYDCDTLPRQWIYFNAFVNPTQVAIPIASELKNVTNNSLFAGIYQNQRGSDVFHAFFDPVPSSSRNAIASATGFLVYDKISQEYRISTEDKLKQLNLPDNMLALSKKGCDLRAEGEINLGMNAGPVEMTGYGLARYFIPTDSAAFNLSIPLYFHFNEKALELMLNDLNSQMDAGAVNLDSRPFNIMLGQTFGNEEAEKLMTEIATQGGAFRRVPKELQKTILISDVEMKYHSKRRSYISTGKIGIAAIGKTQVNKYFDGKLEIENKGSYLEFRLVIDLGGDTYYFFDYNSSSGNMLVFATNTEFMTAIDEAKPDDRKMKSKEEGKTIKYQYGKSTPVAYKKFIRSLEIDG